MARSVYSEITPEMEALADLCVKNGKIDPELYAKYDVKRGLRDINGNGVLTGLTDISEIRSSRMENGVKIPCEGQLFYRGYSIEDLVHSMPSDHSFGFEVTAYLLLFGELPNKEQLDGFIKQLSFYRTLPTNFVRDIIMKAPSGDMMNTLARSVLTMYSYDDAPDDISIPNVLQPVHSAHRHFSASFRLRLSGVSPLSRRQKSLHSPAEAGAYHRRKYSAHPAFR